MPLPATMNLPKGPHRHNAQPHVRQWAMAPSNPGRQAQIARQTTHTPCPQPYGNGDPSTTPRNAHYDFRPTTRPTFAARGHQVHHANVGDNKRPKHRRGHRSAPRPPVHLSAPLPRRDPAWGKQDAKLARQRGSQIRQRLVGQHLTNQANGNLRLVQNIVRWQARSTTKPLQELLDANWSFRVVRPRCSPQGIWQLLPQLHCQFRRRAI